VAPRNSQMVQSAVGGRVRTGDITIWTEGDPKGRICVSLVGRISSSLCTKDALSLSGWVL